ncbi:MAG: HEPN domain-containing protein [Verrucomicrobia bacterium]|nr:HEPN domain-containing protein [Verrucomicrobiota bacterium]
MPEENKFGENMFRQVMDLWVTPEVERRQEARLLPKPLDLRAAQIIFFSDGHPHQIRINDEVKILLKVKIKKGVQKKEGEAVYSNDIEDLELSKLPDNEDPNCGHITIYRKEKTWLISFDLRYNKQSARTQLDAAKEFFDSATFSKDKKNWRSFADTLFSAAELAAKSLLITSDLELARSKKHGAIHSKLNNFAKHGNIESVQREAFNKLSQIRAPARYAEKTFSLREQEAEKLLESVSRMIEAAQKRISD